MADFKERGNQLFAEKQYTLAETYYGKAIMANPHVATFYTNRALCYIKLNQWNLVVEDCQKAIQLEPNLVKAHFFLGRALTELENFEDAITALVKAHELAQQQRKNFGEDIASAVRHAKKMRWKHMEEKRLQQQSDLHTYLLTLLCEHKEKKLSLLSDGTSGTSSSDCKAQEEAIHREYAQREVEVTSIFNELDAARQKREVPDYLCGKISFDLMKDPCITPSGITFDRKDIEDHLQRVGHFDPVTRQPLTEEQLIPNLALKEAVDIFIAQNGWVENY